MIKFYTTVSPNLLSVEAVRKRRLALSLQQLKGKSITSVIDETGDRKKGDTTDYVARQYIGNLGKIESGIVSVNAYGIVGQLTFPLLLKVFKPKQRLKPREVHQKSCNWQHFERVFSDGTTEQRYIQEMIFGRRLQW